MFWFILFFALLFYICYIFYWFYRASSGTSIDNSIVHNFHSHNPSSSSPPPPLVLIFGWAGSKRRYLSRLLSYYENELHWSTISYISPILYYIRSTRYNETSQWEQIILLIEKYYHHYSGQSFSFYIHIHSNNGIFAYAALLDTIYSSSSSITSIQKQIIIKSYKGLIIDSAPYRPLLFSSPFHTAIRSSAPMLMSIYGKFIHPIYTPLMILFLMSIGFYDIIINKKQIPIKWMFDTIDQYHSSIIPTHFLYSTGDKLISSSIIESFINNQKSKKGWIISSKRWDNAAHVDILRSYPEEYKQSIQLFIKQCENK